jgi:hypothetical protein
MRSLFLWCSIPHVFLFPASGCYESINKNKNILQKDERKTHEVWTEEGIFQLNTCGYSPYVTSSLTRGWVYHLQLLLVFASAVILRSESRRTHDHNLLSQIRDSFNQEDQVPVFISHRVRVARLYPQRTGFLFRLSYDSQGCAGDIRPRLHKSQSYIKTDGQSASFSWSKAPIWGLIPDIYYCLTVAGFLM